MDMSYDRSNFEARNFQQKIILEHLPLEYVLICTQLCMRNRDRFDIITRTQRCCPCTDLLVSLKEETVPVPFLPVIPSSGSQIPFRPPAEILIHRPIPLVHRVRRDSLVLLATLIPLYFLAPP
eukprot:g16394.t1